MAFEHLEAIRTRLLQSPTLLEMTGNGDHVYPAHIIDVSDPVYPNLTFFQTDGDHAVWSPRTWDPFRFMLQFSSQNGLEPAHIMYEEAQAMLHMKKRETSNDEVCFHEIREEWANSGIYDQNTSAWIVSARYLARATRL